MVTVDSDKKWTSEKKTGLEKHIGTRTIGYKKGRRWIDLRAAGAPWCELRRPNRAYHMHFVAWADCVRCATQVLPWAAWMWGLCIIGRML